MDAPADRPPLAGIVAAMAVAEPETVLIAAGDALLGDPVRTEHVNVFAIARRAVTNEEYARFRADHGPLDGQPVRAVSWADAVGYCRWLTTSTGHIYRLPDEREWEKAARAGALEAIGAMEWTNSWAPTRAEHGQPRDQPGGRVLKGREDLAKRYYAGDDLRDVGFRVVRGMTGR